MEMYGRVCLVMKIPQIMGWWGIVLIQQTSAAETELPFWREGKELFISLSPDREQMDQGEPVWACWCILRGRGPHTFECKKNTCQGNCMEVIITVNCYPNTALTRPPL